jgi:hypothetical protein
MKSKERTQNKMTNKQHNTIVIKIGTKNTEETDV